MTKKFNGRLDRIEQALAAEQAQSDRPDGATRRALDAFVSERTPEERAAFTRVGRARYAPDAIDAGTLAACGGDFDVSANDLVIWDEIIDDFAALAGSRP